MRTRLCNVEKNVGCNKTNCYINGGTCTYTSKEECFITNNDIRIKKIEYIWNKDEIKEAHIVYEIPNKKACGIFCITTNRYIDIEEIVDMAWRKYKEVKL